MNFLSSIWNGITGVASNVGNWINDLAGNVASSIKAGSNSYNAAAVGAIGEPNPNKITYYNSSGQAYQNNPITAINETTGAQQKIDGQIYYPSKNIKAPSYSGASDLSGQYDLSGKYIGGASVRPSTTSGYQAPTDQYGRVSSQSQGQSYLDSNGNYIVPTQGFSGLSGSGSPSFNFSVPNTGATGASGGGSSFTGTLGGTSGLSTPPVAGTTTDEEQKKKQAQQQQANPLTSALSGILSPWLGPVNVPGMIGNVFGSTSATPINIQPAQQTQLYGPTVPKSINATDLSTSTPENTSLTSLPQASSINDRQDTISKINQNYQEAYNRINQENPTPQNPVIDTPAQAAAIKANPVMQGLLDDWKAQNTQLGALTASRIDVMKKVQAINDTYQGAIDEIKNNPNLPKGLAVRRLEAINTSQKSVLQGLTNQLQILEQQINDQNTVVNNAFHIVEFQQNAQEKARDQALQNLQLMVTSHAIGGFNAQDIQTYSQALGIPASAIVAMKNAANQPDLQTQVVGSSDTGYQVVSIDKKTGKVVSQTQISGLGGNNNNSAMDPTANNLYQQLKTRSIDFSALPADQKKLALQVFAQKGETIPRQLTTAEKTAQQSAISGLNAVGQITSMFENGSLPLARSAILGDSYLGRASGTSQYETLKKEAADVITRIRTGAALNESEVKFYQGLLPQLGDSNEDIQLKLNQLTGFYLGMSGLPVTVTDTKSGNQYQFDDLYDPQQRYGLRQAITSGYNLSY